jgi:hypothetical protein
MVADSHDDLGTVPTGTSNDEVHASALRDFYRENGEGLTGYGPKSSEIQSNSIQDGRADPRAITTGLLQDRIG